MYLPEKDLLGRPVSREPVILDLFADEIKEVHNRETREGWIYIGLMLVPADKTDSLLAALDLARQNTDCDSEIKSTDVESYKKQQLAHAWLDLLHNDQVERRLHLNILGINLTRLNRRAFGGQRFTTIYNRFFRTCVSGALEWCFPEQSIVVRDVYHHRGDQQHSAFFPWHAILQLESEDRGIRFVTREITFLDSDHRSADGRRESHILQFLDLVMGMISQCLDYTSERKPRIEVAQRMYRLLDRMMNAPNNKNSSFGHYRKYCISFFPSLRLTNEQMLDELTRAKSGFYQNRPILQQHMMSSQMRLCFPS